MSETSVLLPNGHPLTERWQSTSWPCPLRPVKAGGELIREPWESLHRRRQAASCELVRLTGVAQAFPQYATADDVLIAHGHLRSRNADAQPDRPLTMAIPASGD